MIGTLLIEQQSKVQEFLDSVARNSEKSKKLYFTGLSHFQTFLSSSNKYSEFTVDSILKPVVENQINIYTLIDNFISYLTTKHKNKLSANAISLYVAAVRSYFLYHDVDIVSGKFKRRVRLPKKFREDEEPLDASDIRIILLSCNNRRLKAYLLTLASGGMRAMEAIGIRNCDIDYSVRPTKIHIRALLSKTRVARDIYVSDECTKFLKELEDYKYRYRRKSRGGTLEKLPDQLVFGKQGRTSDLEGLYQGLWEEFNKILHIVKMDGRKEGMSRRKITLHSLRRNAKTVISTQVGTDYSEWFLGHAGKSVYWTMKESERRELYSSKCMKYLTFLDYTILEITGKNIESQLLEKDKEIQLLKQHDSYNADAIVTLSDQVRKLTEQMELLRK
jgi:integrase